MSRRAHQPDTSQRRQVETLAAYGIPETDISRVVNIDPKTLRKYYRAELDFGRPRPMRRLRAFCSIPPATATSRRKYSGSKLEPDGGKSQPSTGTQARSGPMISPS